MDNPAVSAGLARYPASSSVMAPFKKFSWFRRENWLSAVNQIFLSIHLYLAKASTNWQWDSCRFEIVHTLRNSSYQCSYLSWGTFNSGSFQIFHPICWILCRCEKNLKTASSTGFTRQCQNVEIIIPAWDSKVLLQIWCWKAEIRNGD